MYPKEIIGKRSHEIEAYAAEIIKTNQYNNLGSLLEISVVDERKENNYTLVRVGAGVSNEQLRRWCKMKNLQLKSNTIMVERIWWAGMELLDDHLEVINMGMEMRLLKGSNCSLAPEMGYDYVCSIEVLRTADYNHVFEKREAV
ncbi:unnamed protein product [Sphagnum balticum]